jgi:hypothetical protein
MTRWLGEVRLRLGQNHYTFAIRMCVACVEKWRQEYEYKEPMQYVFDRMSKGSGDIDNALKIAASGGSDAVRRYGIYEDGWSFQSKANAIQLQASDIWAYENYRYAVDRFFPTDDQKKPLRKPYRTLRKRVPSVVRYMKKENLIDLVRRVRESDDVNQSIVAAED